ncbi:unnamed protein product [Caretta caretta]
MLAGSLVSQLNQSGMGYWSIGTR